MKVTRHHVLMSRGNLQPYYSYVVIAPETYMAIAQAGMARPDATVEPELSDVLVRPWRRPFLWLHTRRCPACRRQLARLHEIDRLLRQALGACPPRPGRWDELGRSRLHLGDERQ